MTPGRRRPLYAGGAFGVCGVTACASAGMRVRRGGRRSGQRRKRFHHLATIHGGIPWNRVRVIGATIRRSASRWISSMPMANSKRGDLTQRPQRTQRSDPAAARSERTRCTSAGSAGRQLAQEETAGTQAYAAERLAFLRFLRARGRRCAAACDAFASLRVQRVLRFPSWRDRSVQPLCPLCPPCCQVQATSQQAVTHERTRVAWRSWTDGSSRSCSASSQSPSAFAPADLRRDRPELAGQRRRPRAVRGAGRRVSRRRSPALAARASVLLVPQQRRCGAALLAASARGSDRRCARRHAGVAGDAGTVGREREARRIRGYAARANPVRERARRDGRPARAGRTRSTAPPCSSTHQRDDGSWRLSESQMLGGATFYGTCARQRRWRGRSLAARPPDACRARWRTPTLAATAQPQRCSTRRRFSSDSVRETDRGGRRQRGRALDVLKRGQGRMAAGAVRDVAVRAVRHRAGGAGAGRSVGARRCAPRIRTAIWPRHARARGISSARRMPDGSWPETTRPPNGESYAQRISTTAWALLALLRIGLNRVSPDLVTD